jgi:hypothetical protein
MLRKTLMRRSEGRRSRHEELVLLSCEKVCLHQHQYITYKKEIDFADTIFQVFFLFRRI